MTDRDIPVLEWLARCFLLNRSLIQKLCFEGKNAPRIARRRLEVLSEDGYIQKQNMLVAAAGDEAPSPVYYLSKSGCQFLAEYTGDDRFLWKATRLAQPSHLLHYLAVAKTRILFHEAISRQDAVKLVEWHNEQDVVNATETDQRKHFKLFTEIVPKPSQVVCAPDAAFMLDYLGHRGAFYVEQDRDRDHYSHNKVASRKAPGYAGLQKVWKRHFPTATRETFLPF